MATQSPPEKLIGIPPGAINRSKSKVADAVAQRARALCGDKIGWYGECAVIYAL